MGSSERTQLVTMNTLLSVVAFAAVVAAAVAVDYPGYETRFYIQFRTDEVPDVQCYARYGQEARDKASRLLATVGGLHQSQALCGSDFNFDSHFLSSIFTDESGTVHYFQLDYTLYSDEATTPSCGGVRSHLPELLHGSQQLGTAHHP